MTKKHNKKTGYSLLEVSIAMLIIGILLTSGSVLFSKISRNQNIKQAQLITLERTDKIYKAILNYLSENHKLPCPAKLNSSYDDADYGNESIGNDVAGECDETSFTGNNDSLPANYESDAQNLGATSNMKILYGMIPIDVLDLDKQDAQDGYGNKFSYIMVKEFGVKTPSHTAITGFEYFAGSNRLRDAAVTPEIIDYINIKSKQSGATTTLSNKSIMLIISHGENGLGAYIPDSGIQKPTVGAPNDEDRNMYANTNYDRVFFVDSDETKTANDEILFFDDYVIFKTKDQLLRDAEMEFVKCGGQQGFVNEDYNDPCFNGDFTPNRNSSYGETMSITSPDDIVTTTVADCNCISDNASLQRVCGKYGKWSDISCNENHVIHEIDQVRALESGNLQLTDDSGNGISIADGGEISLSTDLAVTHGGTGVSTLTDSKLLIGAGTGAVQTSTNLHWDNVNERLGIGTNSPSASAILDISGTNGALLVPRMTTAERNLLTAADGMIIYNISTNSFNFYENGIWISKN